MLSSRCIACGDQALPPAGLSGLCHDCSLGLPWLSGSLCGKCGRPLVKGIGLCIACREREFHFDLCRSLWANSGPARAIVRAYKYGRDLRPIRLFREVLTEKMREFPANGLIVPVPSDPRRKRARGWDPVSFLLGRGGIRRMGKILSKKHGQEQKRKGLEERLSGPSGTVMVREAIDAGTAIILVDDVVTTGATLSECARALKEAGAGRVDCLTLVREL